MTPQERAVVTAFADEAKRFVAFVDGAGALPLHERAEQLAARLAALYAAGLALPAITDEDAFGHDVQRDRPRAHTWPGLARQYYWTPLTTFAEDGEPAFGTGDIDDDVLDVLGNVADGLDAWERGLHAAAAWHWQFTFETHWGEHAVDCLRVVHQIVERARRGEA